MPETQALNIPRSYAHLIFLVGMSCMVVAGFFLIEGLSQFSGDATTRNILIVGGILFQITESLCFIAAASLSFHSVVWRITLFGLGCILFLFSIAVMTLAQKTALQTGINTAAAIDQKRVDIRAQLESLDRMIDSYRLNAERQSKSIYKDSRAMGQDSINRAIELEQKKINLSNELYQLNQERRETSADFFQRMHDVTGLPAKETEFYFLVIRSLLLELSGILLMAFGANLRVMTKPAQASAFRIPVVQAGKWFSSPLSQQRELPLESGHEKTSDYDKHRVAEKTARYSNDSGPKPATKTPLAIDDDIPPNPLADAPELLAKTDSIQAADPVRASDTVQAGGSKTIPPEQTSSDQPQQSSLLDSPIEVYDEDDNVLSFKQHSFSKYIEGMKRSQKQLTASSEIQELGDCILDLHQSGELKSLSRDSIIRALREHQSVKIGSVKAKHVQTYCEERIKDDQENGSS